MQPAHKILLICYGFPPKPGIGGRRWAKFARYLAQKNVEVHVIHAAMMRGEKESAWLRDVQHPLIRRYELPLRYPEVLMKGAAGVTGKVQYKLGMGLIKLFSRGTWINPVFFWKKQLLRESKKIIQEQGIRDVIVTVPPFRLAYLAAAIKKELPQIQLVLDYRDPWSDNYTFHGFLNLPEKRRAYERARETEALEAADIVLTTTDQMTENAKSKLKQGAEKCVTLINGFDPEDVAVAAPKAEDTNRVYRFLHAGNLYPNLGYILSPLVEALRTMKQSHPDVYARLQFDFYGQVPTEFAEAAKDLGAIRLHGWVTLEKVQREIADSDFTMVFAAPDHAFNFNTKFYESIAARKPIVLFSKEGAAPDFIRTHNLGVVMRPELLAEDLDILASAPGEALRQYNMSFDLAPYSIEGLTDRLLALLKK